jgi:hypothetical protein
VRFRIAAHSIAMQYFLARETILVRRPLDFQRGAEAIQRARRKYDANSKRQPGPQQAAFETKKSADVISGDGEMRVAVGAADREIGGNRPGMIHAHNGAPAFRQHVARNQRRPGAVAATLRR